MDVLRLHPTSSRDAGDLVDLFHFHLHGVIGASYVNGRQEVRLANGDRIQVVVGARPVVADQRPRAVLLETVSPVASSEIEHALVETIEGARVIAASMTESLLSLPDGVRLVLVARADVADHRRSTPGAPDPA